MSGIKDDTGLTPKERHDIVLKYLKEIKKKSKVFHLRWKSGNFITKDVLVKTPLFWYMRYGWTRMQIETMLYKARVVIDDVLDSGLQQVFGGDAGPRFKNSNNDIPKRKVWKNRAIVAQTLIKCFLMDVLC